jgi:hypothetical protein
VPTPSESPRAALTFAALGLHLLLALAVVAICAEPLRGLVLGLRGPVSFADEVPSVVWLAPALAGGLLFAQRLVRFARGARTPVATTWGALVVLVAAGAARLLNPPPERLVYTRVQDAPPAVQTVTVLRQLRERIEAALGQGGKVPTVAELEAALRSEDGSPIVPSYRYRWMARRPFVLKRLDGMNGAVLQRLPDDLAGTLYLAVAPDQRRYWLTAVVLLDDNGTRSSDLLPGGAGPLVMSNTLEGR